MTDWITLSPDVSVRELPGHAGIEIADRDDCVTLSPFEVIELIRFLENLVHKGTNGKATRQPR